MVGRMLKIVDPHSLLQHHLSRYILHQLWGKIQPGKRHYKESCIEEKLLEIIEEPKTKLDEDEMFCLCIASTLKKIKDPQKKEYAKLQLQQCVYNSLYGQGPSNQQGNQTQYAIGNDS